MYKGTEIEQKETRLGLVTVCQVTLVCKDRMAGKVEPVYLFSTYSNVARLDNGQAPDIR